MARECRCMPDIRKKYGIKLFDENKYVYEIEAGKVYLDEDLDTIYFVRSPTDRESDNDEYGDCLEFEIDCDEDGCGNSEVHVIEDTTTLGLYKKDFTRNYKEAMKMIKLLKR